MRKSGWHHSEETKQKISMGNKGKNKGNRHSEITKRQMSESHKNPPIHLREQARQRMLGNKYGKLLKGVKQSAQTIAKRVIGRQGYRHSEVTKQRIAMAHSPESKERAREWCIQLNSRVPRETGIEKKIRLILLETKEMFKQYAAFPGIGTTDFYLPYLRLAIEADGNHWHSAPHVIARDKRKDEKLEAMGITVLRFSETQINKNISAVMQQIIQAIKLAKEND